MKFIVYTINVVLMTVALYGAVSLVHAQDPSAEARKAEFQAMMEQKREAWQATLEVKATERAEKRAQLNEQARIRVQAFAEKIRTKVKEFSSKLQDTATELKTNIDAVGDAIDTSEAQRLLVEANIAILASQAEADAVADAMYAASEGYISPDAVNRMYTDAKNSAVEAKQLLQAALNAYKVALAQAVDDAGIIDADEE